MLIEYGWGRLLVQVSRPDFFIFINIGSVFPRTIQSTGSVPDPSPGISESTSSQYSHWPDITSSPGTGHWGTRSLSWSPSGLGHLPVLAVQ